MIFVSNPSILFKKSQVLQVFFFFFFLLSLKLTVLSTVVFLFPKCVFCQWEKLFSEKEGVCVCVCVCACMHAQKRQIEGHIEKEREGCVCVSLCVCACVSLQIYLQKIQPSPSRDHFVQTVIFAFVLFICRRQRTDLSTELI